LRILRGDPSQRQLLNQALAALRTVIVDQQAILAALAETNRKADQIMSDQSKLDVIVTELTAQVTALSAAAADIATELAALKATVPAAVALDFTALDAAVAALGTATAAVVADAPPVTAPPTA